MSAAKVPPNLNPEDVRIGATCKAFREAAGYKVGQAANALDISYAYLSNIEAGRKPLTEVLLARMAGLYRKPQGAFVRPDHFLPADSAESVPA